MSADRDPAIILYDAAGNQIAVEDGVAIPAGTRGLLVMGQEGSTARRLRVASDGTLRIDPSGTTTQPISAAALPLPAGAATEATLATRATEATLEAARVLLVSLDGKDYATETTLSAIGALVALLEAKDFATETTLATRATEATLELVRLLLVSLDAKDFATETTLATRATEATLELVRLLLVSLDGKDFATETTLATRATEATLLAADGRLTTIDAVLDSIKDTDGIKKITDELPAGTQQIGLVAQGTKAALADGWPVVLADALGNDVDITNDAGTYRLNIIGKVTVTGASPPPATTEATIFGDTPLTVGTDDTVFVIPNGETFFLQEIVAGNEDPTKGASVTVLFDDGTEHVIARIYIAGTTLTVGYPDRDVARDGTALVGNGTNEIILRRAKFSGSNIAIDAVVRGYTA